MNQTRTLVLSAALCLALGACSEAGGGSSQDPGPDAGAGDVGADVGADVGTDVVPGGDAGPLPGGCVDDVEFFEEVLWDRLLGPVCSTCHTAQGVARNSALVFEPPAVSNYLEVNRAILADVAALERDGVSLVLLKPSAQVAHDGGEVAAVGSDGYQLLEEFVTRLDSPVTCDDDEPEAEDLAGLDLLSPALTLRKATLALAGRLPTTDEWQRVEGGGEDELRDVVWEVMREDAFFERLKEIYNDALLVRAYESGQDGVALLDDDDFPSRYWYDDSTEDNSERNRWRARASEAVAHEALELIAHVVRQGRPFTEILTADYTMVNRFSATSYGIFDHAFTPGDDEVAAREDWVEARIPGYNHAGILSGPAFLNRFPTTDTNRNRHRVWVYFRLFLATDILGFADRPIDPTETATHNPTLNDPQCTVCHATMDPVAGAFQNWDEEGRYRPPAPEDGGWYPSMAEPGFGDVTLPADRRADALRWLAEQTIADSRFALSITQTVFEAVTGIEVRPPVVRVDDELDTVERDAYRLQRAELERIADEFVANEYDLRIVFEEVVMSPYFRAVDAGSAGDAATLDAGTHRLRTPEQLSRLIETVTGYPWARDSGRTPYLFDSYRLLYGGIDSDGITTRASEPSGIIANIGLRIATDMACTTVARDFVLEAQSRRLFPFVEPTYLPETDEGFSVPGAEDAIRRNIQYLHFHMLGEELPLDHAEVDATYELWEATWREGKAAVAAEEVSSNLFWSCRGRSDWWTGEELPSERQINSDPDYAIRAWQAVFAYLATDYRFLYE